MLKKAINAKDYFICKKEVFERPISERAKIVYVFLSRCASDDKRNFLLANDIIASKCSIPETAVPEAIKELVQAGLLQETKVSQKGEETTVSINFPFLV